MELSAEAFAKGGDSDYLDRRCVDSVSVHNDSVLVRQGVEWKVTSNS
jgi:hypothetical protein